MNVDYGFFNPNSEFERFQNPDNPMNSTTLATITTQIKRALSVQREVAFAYIHGSILSSEHPQDVDIGVFLYPEAYDEFLHNGDLSLGLAIPLEMELEKTINKKVDLQVLNVAPLSFRYRVVSEGILVVDKNIDIRITFEYLSRVKYFDFRRRRKEYLSEVVNNESR
jgi:predicted nucleotidyltransferase